MPGRFDLIVFDWDGTLMDSTAAIASSIQLACADIGLPVPSDAQASHVIGLGLHDALAHAVPDLTPKLLPRMLERYRYHYLMHDHALKLFPEVPEMLGDLKAAGYFIAVATGKSRAGLERGFEASGLKSYFDGSRCADETHSKPNPAMLFELSDLFGIDLSRTLMIGDTTHDLQMAANARACGVGVSYGAHPEAALRDLEPLTCCASSSALRRWLREHA